MHHYGRLIAWLQRPSVKCVLLWLVGAALAEMFIKNGFRKFDPDGFWTEAFTETWGFPLWFMYFIGVVEFVAGILILVPRFIPAASLALATVMAGAMMTKGLAAVFHGLPAEHAYNFALDQLFFVSTIATLLYLAAYWSAARGAAGAH